MSDLLTTFRDTFVASFRNNLDWFLHHELQPSFTSFFWWLVGLTVVVYALELAFPWRRGQRALREDFWLDLFYVFFNIVVFPVLGFLAAGAAVWALVAPGLAAVGLEDGLLPVRSLPVWAQLVALFLLRDFVHWNVHRLLHAVPWLWQFHKLHHSVRQMGVAAHLRYHWMENVVYKALEALPIAILGFTFDSFFVVAVFTLAIGHLNHANLYLPIGPLRYVFNTPQMHIWHHAHDLPPGRSGVNFGLTLSVWDWLFGTVWWPGSGRDVQLGFPGDEAFPRHDLLRQLVWPLSARTARQPAEPTAQP
jgi:sterol desaturase/sphingolipid hydroxylase (fatty acid hydroxylase superfamily)